MNTQTNFSLVADIGGTNARFALVESSQSELLEPRNLVCADYPTIVDAIQAYLEMVSVVAVPDQASISIATAVAGDRLKMTNHHWQFSISQTREALGLNSLKVLNDYTALALALPFIPQADCRQIGPGESCEGFTKAVIGPGTGLGVSGLVAVGSHWYPLESEGGHASYGPLNDREAEIIQFIRQKLKHVSTEALVSGPGIALLYEAITCLQTGTAKHLKPGEITNLALENQCEMAVEALSVFCAVLGTAAGNLALTLGARGGVYIGGGIVRKVADFFAASDFRQRFEQHGRFTDYLKQIPSYVIDTDYPALTGAMVALNEEYKSVGFESRSSL